MLGLLNKKEKVEAVDAQIATPAQPTTFEVGKQISFKDNKTGEMVFQIAMNPDQRKALMGSMVKNSGVANRFMVTSRQKLQLEEQLTALNKEITDSEKEINEIINKVRDELNLDKRWGLNIQLGVLERRDPPNG